MTYQIECPLFDVTFVDDTLHDAAATRNKHERHLPTAPAIVDPAIDGLDLPYAAAALSMNMTTFPPAISDADTLSHSDSPHTSGHSPLQVFLAEWKLGDFDEQVLADNIGYVESI